MDADPPNDPATGSVQLRGVPCRVYLDELAHPHREERSVKPKKAARPVSA
jgi:hypothetical protein